MSTSDGAPLGSGPDHSTFIGASPPAPIQNLPWASLTLLLLSAGVTMAGRCRSAHPQLHAGILVSRIEPRVLDALQQQSHRALGLRVQRLRDGGQRDAVQSGEGDVVEPDDGQVVRDAHPPLLAGLDEGDGPDVVGDEHAGRRRAPAQGGAQLARLAPDGDRARARRPRVDGERLPAGAAQRRPIAVVAGPVAAGLDQRRAHVGDAPVPEREQVLGGEDAAVAVARAHQSPQRSLSPRKTIGMPARCSASSSCAVRAMYDRKTMPATRCCTSASTPVIAGSWAPSMLQKIVV